MLHFLALSIRPLHFPAPVGGAENGVRVTGVTVTGVIAAETGLAGRLVDGGVATTASNVEAASCSSSPRGLLAIITVETGLSTGKVVMVTKADCTSASSGGQGDMCAKFTGRESAEVVAVHKGVDTEDTVSVREVVVHVDVDELDFFLCFLRRFAAVSLTIVDSASRFNCKKV